LRHRNIKYVRNINLIEAELVQCTTIGRDALHEHAASFETALRASSEAVKV
jgi:hypothetical protein